MTTFVLVHGAWGGAHSWRTVRPLLWAAGHAVFTPSLTGIGERAHLAHPHIDLSTHVDDVVQQVMYEDLVDIVLVGFSYGGMVVTGALDHIGDRVRELVYLDAFVPSDGQSAVDLAPPIGRPSAAAHWDREWLIPPMDRTFDDPAEQAFAGPRRSPQPIRTLTEPVSLSQPVEQFPLGLTYIKATGDPRPGPFWDAADATNASDRWRYEEIGSNHMVPQNKPAELAEILLSLAAR